MLQVIAQCAIVLPRSPLNALAPATLALGLARELAEVQATGIGIGVEAPHCLIQPQPVPSRAELLELAAGFGESRIDLHTQAVLQTQVSQRQLTTPPMT